MLEVNKISRTFFLILLLIIFARPLQARQSPITLSVMGGFSPNLKIKSLLPSDQYNFDIELAVSYPIYGKNIALSLQSGVIYHKLTMKSEFETNTETTTFMDRRLAIPIEIYGTYQLSFHHFFRFTAGFGIGAYWSRLTNEAQTGQLPPAKYHMNNHWKNPHVAYFLALQVKIISKWSAQLMAKQRYARLDYGVKRQPFYFELDKIFILCGLQYSLY
ncbi:MAG: hypothetical protein ACE5KJ_06890 [Candidatus Zixiibacteriota bacterium]